MSTDSVTNSADTTSSQRYTGRVKWFNTRAGYGFVTITDGSKSGNDVFVHHTSINVENEQYRYLVQGEYVEFSLSDVMRGDHEYQAADVSGIKGGKLMCETRRDLRNARTNYKSTKNEDSPVNQAPRRQPTRQVKEQTNGWQHAKPNHSSKDSHPRSPTSPPKTRPVGSQPRAPLKTRKPRA